MVLPLRWRFSIRALIVLAATSLLIRDAAARDLSFQERVAAQRSIERAYYAHQIGATLPFETAVPQELLEKKVRTYLKQSVALEKFYASPISGEALRAETHRMFRDTRFPDRLREILAGLDNDAFVFEECFVRPVLADRLVRSFFLADSRPEKSLQGPGERFAFGPEGDARGPAGQRSSSPPRQHPSWDEWWRDVEPSLESESTPAVASPSDALPSLPEGVAPEAAGCASDNTWENGALDDLPDPREYHTAVWTGSLMIVWGGFNGSHLLNIGSRYDPLTDTWSSIAGAGAPTERQNHTAIWTGSVMVVWGGMQSGGSAVGTGGRYNPVTDTWLPVSTTNVAGGRNNHTALWTGTEMPGLGGEIQHLRPEFGRPLQSGHRRLGRDDHELGSGGTLRSRGSLDRKRDGGLGRLQQCLRQYRRSLQSGDQQLDGDFTHAPPGGPLRRRCRLDRVGHGHLGRQ